MGRTLSSLAIAGNRQPGTLAVGAGQDIRRRTKSSVYIESALRGNLIQNRAETDPWSDDPRLLGRTYAIPFDRVWRDCLELVSKRSRWELLHTDDLAGIIRVRCTTPVFRFKDDLEIGVLLDENGLTRVDLRSRSITGRRDLGVNARRIGSFLFRLDKRLGAGKGTIIDPKDAVDLTSGAQ